MDIDTIASASATVAAEYQEALDANQAVLATESELLQRVVDAARPALHALSTRRRIGMRRWWPDSTCGETQYTSGPRALCVHGDGPDEDYSRANEGSYEGSDLFLNPDGTWTRATYSGSWSRWQGASSDWDAADELLTTREVADAYDVDEIVSAIGEALTKAVGSRERSTKAAKERAEKLAALAKLVR